MENNNDMSIFSNLEGLELNFDDLDLDTTEEPIVDEEVEESDTVEEDNNNNNEPGEDQIDSEEVAGEDDQEDEGDDTAEDGDDTQHDEADTSQIYSSLASLLNEEGVLPSLDLENTKVESVDDLTSTIKAEIENQVRQSLIDKIGEEGYNAIEKGVTLQEYQSYNTSLEALDSINEEHLKSNLELAKKVIMQDYIEQGIDQKRASRILKRVIDLGEESIIEDAKESLESLKEVQSRKLEALAAQREQERAEIIKNQQKIDNDLKNTIYSSKEIIKGLKINKSMKDKVYKSITSIVGNDDNGNAENKLMRHRRENPIDFDTKLYYLYELTGGFSDFSKLVSKSESKAAQRLEGVLRSTKFGSSTSPSYVDDPESYGGIAGGTELVM